MLERRSKYDEEMERMKSETDCSPNVKVNVPLHDIASEDEDDEGGLGNKKPINLDVDTTKKSVERGRFSPARN